MKEKRLILNDENVERTQTESRRMKSNGVRNSRHVTEGPESQG
jgi:hypothetical protein